MWTLIAGRMPVQLFQKREEVDSLILFNIIGIVPIMNKESRNGKAKTGVKTEEGSA